MVILSAMPEAVAGILTFLASVAGPVAGIVTTVVLAVRHARKKAMAAADKPTVPPAPQLPTPPTNPFGHAPPPTDPALLLRLDRMALDTERGHMELRTAFREELRSMLAEQTRQLLAERQRRKELETQVAGRQQQIATLENALALTNQELARVQRALLEARARESELLAAMPQPEPIETLKTPLRPAPLRR